MLLLAEVGFGSQRQLWKIKDIHLTIHVAE
jgi:hypothetical protein